MRDTERYTESQKEANDFQWYKEQADALDGLHHQLGYGFSGTDVSEFKRMKVNYDLFNNKIDLNDFSYVCQPFGATMGELPAKMVNRDIVSPKIKTILGMEMKRPFSWTVLAVNPEATSRKEQKETDMVRQFVVNTIMQPIQQQLEIQMQEQMKGQELTPEQQQEIQQQLAEELKARTPEEVYKYMAREHQDPSEILASQLLEYHILKLDIKRKFNHAFKHGLLSGTSLMYASVLNGSPVAWNVNSMRFNCQKSPDTYLIEDSENCTCEFRMTPAEIVKFFGDQLTEYQISQIFDNQNQVGNKKIERWLSSDSESISDSIFDVNDINAVRVLHCVWKSLRRIGFLQYIDQDNVPQEMLVNDTYKLNPDVGDLSIEWEWIPECYETWKINSDIYVNMRPVPNQIKDLNNVWECKLPYYGIVYDNLNSKRTSLMDRLKSYQYFYNIIMYRLELLLASDKGKKVMMNINMIPASAGIDLKKWQYFFESSPFMWYDPNEEGSTYNDVNTIAKAIDLSLVSDIQKYIEIAEYIRTQCGRSVGITDQVEGQIAEREAVSNTRQSMIQTGYILEPYFEYHAIFKKNFLQALIDICKVAYSGSQNTKMAYVTDDMSQTILALDTELLDATTYGIFVVDSARADETKELIRQLAHAALQNQKVELSDVIAVIKQDNIEEAEETLKVAESRRLEQEQQARQQEQQAQQQMQQQQMEFEEKLHQYRMEEIVLKEEERRKTEIAKMAIMGASYNPDKDSDEDGVNDFLQLSEELSLKKQELALKKDALDHKKVYDDTKLALEKEKIKVQAKKKSN